MPLTIQVPTPLRAFVGQQRSVEVRGETVGQALQDLTSTYPDLKPHLFDEQGRLRSFVNVYVNDEDIRYLQREHTAVREGDAVSIVPSVAGGSTTAPGASLTDALEDLPELTPDEIRRYSRHLLLPDVGIDGQRRLRAARVLCIGAGGLGSPASLYLAAAGVSTLGLVDFDAVDYSNLQRQILHDTNGVGQPKLASARARLEALNPGVRIESHEVMLSSANALEILREYDVVLDGTDNFATRYLVNDACVLLGKPNAYGSIFQFEGQASVFATREGPCYRCLYPEPPPPGLVPSCAEGGVLGVLPGIVGTIQATEAIKLILGRGEPLVGRLLSFDALTMRFREFKLRRDEACPVCGPRATIRELIDYHQFCGVPVPGAAHKDALPPELEISPEETRALMNGGLAPFVLDVREPQEYQICRIDGATLIPLGQLPKRLEELPPPGSREIVVHCKSGVRSAKALRLLEEQGWTRVRNLRGGILNWIDRVDPTQPKY